MENQVPKEEEVKRKFHPSEKHFQPFSKEAGMRGKVLRQANFSTSFKAQVLSQKCPQGDEL